MTSAFDARVQAIFRAVQAKIDAGELPGVSVGYGTFAKKKAEGMTTQPDKDDPEFPLEKTP